MTHPWSFPKFTANYPELRLNFTGYPGIAGAVAPANFRGTRTSFGLPLRGSPTFCYLFLAPDRLYFPATHTLVPNLLDFVQRVHFQRHEQLMHTCYRLNLIATEGSKSFGSNFFFVQHISAPLMGRQLMHSSSQLTSTMQHITRVGQNRIYIYTHRI
jgi:hypothetical protein